jgi:hypothetical protein
MKSKIITFSLLILGLTVALSGCKKDEDITDRYSFWKGEFENYYYILDMNDQPLHLVKGKPFMVLEYDPVSGVPLKCEFGLYEAHNEYLTGAQGAIPQPFLSASDLAYAKRLELTGSVDLLCNWATVSSHEELSAGGF